MVCSFVGVIMIMSSKFMAEDEEKAEVSSVEYMVGCVLIFGMSLMVAVIGVYVRKM